MENTKENILEIGDNMTMWKLRTKGKRTVRKIIATAKNHKIISMAIISLVIFSTLNIIMIYQFLKILQNF